MYMTLFYLKKNFCDGWDSLLWIVFFNLLVLAIVAGAFFAVTAVASVSPLFSLLLLIASASLLMIPLLSISDACARIADFKSVPIKDVFLNFPNVWKDAILFGLLISIFVFMTFVGLPFYFGMGNILGLLLGSMIFWVLLIASLSLQWFMPLRSRFGGGFRKNIKKSFIMFFDNPGFSIFVGIYSFILFVMSAFIAFMAPGAVGIILAHNNALRLRVYKYDWLEQHPELPPKEARKQIPWDELVAEDRETLGPRDIKSFIFPWK